jgi:hypothetical protein
MDVRDAVEADAEALARLAGSPADVMRNLVHDRTVRVATSAEPDDVAGSGDGDSVRGFVSFDARERTVYVTQVGGDRAACERLLEEPIRFARAERMNVELLISDGDEELRRAAEAAGFADDGAGPRFAGGGTVRYLMRPSNDPGPEAR